MRAHVAWTRIVATLLWIVACVHNTPMVSGCDSWTSPSNDNLFVDHCQKRDDNDIISQLTPLLTEFNRSYPITGLEWFLDIFYNGRTETQGITPTPLSRFLPLYTYEEMNAHVTKNVMQEAARDENGMKIEGNAFNWVPGPNQQATAGEIPVDIALAMELVTSLKTNSFVKSRKSDGTPQTPTWSTKIVVNLTEIRNTVWGPKSRPANVNWNVTLGGQAVFSSKLEFRYLRNQIRADSAVEDVPWSYSHMRMADISAMVKTHVRTLVLDIAGRRTRAAAGPGVAENTARFTRDRRDQSPVPNALGGKTYAWRLLGYNNVNDTVAFRVDEYDGTVETEVPSRVTPTAAEFLRTDSGNNWSPDVIIDLMAQRCVKCRRPVGVPAIWPTNFGIDEVAPEMFEAHTMVSLYFPDLDTVASQSQINQYVEWWSRYWMERYSPVEVISSLQIILAKYYDLPGMPENWFPYYPLLEGYWSPNKSIAITSIPYRVPLIESVTTIRNAVKEALLHYTWPGESMKNSARGLYRGDRYVDVLQWSRTYNAWCLPNGMNRMCSNGFCTNGGLPAPSCAQLSPCSPELQALRLSVDNYVEWRRDVGIGPMLSRAIDVLEDAIDFFGDSHHNGVLTLCRGVAGYEICGANGTTPFSDLMRPVCSRPSDKEGVTPRSCSASGSSVTARSSQCISAMGKCIYGVTFQNLDWTSGRCRPGAGDCERRYEGTTLGPAFIDRTIELGAALTARSNFLRSRQPLISAVPWIHPLHGILVCGLATQGPLCDTTCGSPRALDGKGVTRSHPPTLCNGFGTAPATADMPVINADCFVNVELERQNPAYRESVSGFVCGNRGSCWTADRPSVCVCMPGITAVFCDTCTRGFWGLNISTGGGCPNSCLAPALDPLGLDFDPDPVATVQQSVAWDETRSTGRYNMTFTCIDKGTLASVISISAYGAATVTQALRLVTEQCGLYRPVKDVDQWVALRYNCTFVTTGRVTERLSRYCAFEEQSCATLTVSEYADRFGRGKRTVLGCPADWDVQLKRDYYTHPDRMTTFTSATFDSADPNGCTPTARNILPLRLSDLRPAGDTKQIYPQRTISGACALSITPETSVEKTASNTVTCDPIASESGLHGNIAAVKESRLGRRPYPGILSPERNMTNHNFAERCPDLCDPYAFRFSSAVWITNEDGNRYDDVQRKMYTTGLNTVMFLGCPVSSIPPRWLVDPSRCFEERFYDSGDTIESVLQSPTTRQTPWAVTAVSTLLRNLRDRGMQNLEGLQRATNVYLFGWDAVFRIPILPPGGNWTRTAFTAALICPNPIYYVPSLSEDPLKVPGTNTWKTDVLTLNGRNAIGWCLGPTWNPGVLDINTLLRIADGTSGGTLPSTEGDAFKARHLQMFNLYNLDSVAISRLGLYRHSRTVPVRITQCKELPSATAKYGCRVLGNSVTEIFREIGVTPEYELGCPPFLTTGQDTSLPSLPAGTWQKAYDIQMFFRIPRADGSVRYPNNLCDMELFSLLQTVVPPSQPVSRRSGVTIDQLLRSIRAIVQNRVSGIGAARVEYGFGFTEDIIGIFQDELAYVGGQRYICLDPPVVHYWASRVVDVPVQRSSKQICGGPLRAETCTFGGTTGLTESTCRSRGFVACAGAPANTFCACGVNTGCSCAPGSNLDPTQNCARCLAGTFPISKTQCVRPDVCFTASHSRSLFTTPPMCNGHGGCMLIMTALDGSTSIKEYAAETVTTDTRDAVKTVAQCVCDSGWTGEKCSVPLPGDPTSIRTGAYAEVTSDPGFRSVSRNLQGFSVCTATKLYIPTGWLLTYESDCERESTRTDGKAGAAYAECLRSAREVAMRPFYYGYNKRSYSPQDSKVRFTPRTDVEECESTGGVIPSVNQIKDELPIARQVYRRFWVNYLESRRYSRNITDEEESEIRGMHRGEDFSPVKDILQKRFCVRLFGDDGALNTYFIPVTEVLVQARAVLADGFTYPAYVSETVRINQNPSGEICDYYAAPLCYSVDCELGKPRHTGPVDVFT